MKIDWLYFFAYLVILMPLSVTDDSGVNVTANYLFIPFFFISIVKNSEHLTGDAIAFISSFVIAFFLGVCFAVGQTNDMLSIVGVCAFNTSVYIAYGLIISHDLSHKFVEFKYAVIAIGLFFAIWAISFYFSTLGIALPDDIAMVKSLMYENIAEWPQRIAPFIYASLVFSLAIKKPYIKYTIAGILLGSLLISFARTVYLALGAVTVYTTLMRFKNNNIYKCLLMLCVLSLLIVFYDAYDMLFEHINAVIESSRNSESSEGKRLEILIMTFELMIVSPLVGYGGASFSKLTSFHGSSESQYLDTMIRYGLVGLFSIFWVVKKAIKSLKSEVDASLVTIIIFFAVFSFFHESIKLTYNAVVFFTIISYCLHKKHAVFNR